MQESSLKSRLIEVLERFPRLRVAVLGDFIVDLYIYSLASRVSREAPVLILRYEGERMVLGGGANALNNVRSLGVEAIPVGFLGDDENGRRLRERMEELGMDTRYLVEVPGRITPTKTRILAGSHHTVKQQVVRLDREPDAAPPVEFYGRLIDRLESVLDGVDALLVSDYGYGTVSGPVMDFLKGLNHRLITVDSRYRVLDFRGVTACTPNEPEAAAALGWSRIDDGNIEEAGFRLLELTGNRAVLITRGRKGMALFERGKPPVHIGIYGTDEVADVTGAGDTVIATFTCALAAGATFYEAARLANYAGGIVVMKMGTATVSVQELVEAVEDDLQ